MQKNFSGGKHIKAENMERNLREEWSLREKV